MIDCVWEHNGSDSLLYTTNYIGAYTRGESLASAKAKMPQEITSYCRWLDMEEYEALKALALYESIPDKNAAAAPQRKTFYGQLPRTANEMYEHTKNVNAYYFAEINVNADNDGTIRECRMRGFDILERQPDFLRNTVTEGSYGEDWSLRKVLRRFI